MEYFIIFILQIIGIGLSVMQKISGLGDKYPTEGRQGIINIFFKEDWDTLCISFLVLALNIVGHYVIEEYTNLSLTIENYALYAFALALILGYAGQRLVYKWLGSSEKFLDKKVTEKLG